jgi:holo-[acyl-carrier protein] synthase
MTLKTALLCNLLHDRGIALGKMGEIIPHSMILGIGLDIVEVSRIRSLLERHPERFKERAFTAAEVEFCEGCADAAVHYAARFAAKEAAAKALGTGFADGVSWRDIEVLREQSGAPRLALHGGAKRLSEEKRILRAHVTLTHTRETAAAQVILEGDL